jgi:hypothetical protein
MSSHVAHAIFEQAAVTDAAAPADNAEGVCLGGLHFAARLSHAARGAGAAADALIRKLLHAFTEKQLQRALAIVDQVRAACALARCCSAAATDRALVKTLAAWRVVRGGSRQPPRPLPGTHAAADTVEWHALSAPRLAR